jgi:hypothetical protein
MTDSTFGTSIFQVEENLAFANIWLLLTDIDNIFKTEIA